ncbi:hypothetical protein TRV_07686 [Trichophyton verrucosum HKI 0517]|uniref:Pre-mRNA-splicing factor 18 n=1 Tax=Trichophyton verrucosum (strain HKI 0517) TaxID=663202 RepID=D4DKG4_TRIVH|nr:uncharacterized protein TRV_07686 [Trichophyton verrucosum HKI 0517]EFE37662.1 hypothetical protein TRV_07686 [Trichophyton verrucosum HKI 0517]
MDFASLMSKEISKAKSDAAEKKYTKRSDIEAARVAAYNAEQEKLQREREERAELKRRRDEEEAEQNRRREEKRRRLAEESRARREAEEEAREKERRKRLGLAEDESSSEKDGTTIQDGEDLDDDELVGKLRELGEPARLFGESHKGRLRRYRNLVNPEQNRKKLTDGPIPTTLELVPEADMKVPDKLPADEEGKRYLFRQLASYFTLVLKEWEIALAQRDDSVKQTFQGKQAYNAMVQSRENMRPLFKKFENGDIEDGILEPVVEIVRNAQNRRYVDANDGYLTLSIGKAAWPIGVTMVGIHERSAREKLHEGGKGQAHIMSDEITRKFLQSIKRCLTFAQVRWPPDDQLQLMG